MNPLPYMLFALELAKKGSPLAFPNPLVGCVIVYKDEIVASGYHQKYGEAHAEVTAIMALPSELSTAECTLYVTLEPCSHHGKTPPCADLIIAKGFKKVVIAAGDPNPLVAGKGIKKMQEAGIEVITGVLEKEALELNKRFYTFHQKKRPYLILKWAQTEDGFISRMPLPENKAENHISREEANSFIHQLRAEVMGIFVGKNTVLYDNPRLTTRLVAGANPIRLFIDKNLEVPTHFAIYNNDAKTIVFNAIKEEEQGHIRFIKLDFTKTILEQVCDKLYHLGIQTLLVEGGATLLNALIKQNLWDEVLIIENPDLSFTTGLKAPEFALKNSFSLLGDDKLFKTLNGETL